MINCIDDEWPVHRFIAIVEVTFEDKSQDILVRARGMDINLTRKQRGPDVMLSGGSSRFDYN